MACAGGALLDISCPKAEVKRGPGTLHPPARLPACQSTNGPLEKEFITHCPLAACLLVQGVVQGRGTSPAAAEEEKADEAEAASGGGAVRIGHDEEMVADRLRSRARSSLVQTHRPRRVPVVQPSHTSHCAKSGSGGSRGPRPRPLIHPGTMYGG